MSTRLTTVLLTTLISALTSLHIPLNAQKKSQDRFNQLLGDWYGRVSKGKSIFPIPDGGAPIQLTFEKDKNGELVGYLKAQSQGGKLEGLNWDVKSNTLIGRTRFLALALKIELKLADMRLNGRITGLGIDMPITAGREPPGNRKGGRGFREARLRCICNRSAA